MAPSDPTPALDPRLAAFRPDLADVRLEGRVEATRFAEGAPMRVAAPLASFRGRPDADAGVTATKLMGEPLLVFDRHEGWAWAQSEVDGYVGYTPEAALAEGWLSGAVATVTLPRSHIYPEPDLKIPPTGWAPLGARVALAEPRDDIARFLRLAEGGWIYAEHLSADLTEDWVAVAESLLHAPYLWGGDSVAGVDCSGLIRLGLMRAGRPCPRDSDQQEAVLGAPAPEDAPLQRGDLVFWRGHVGVMRDPTTLLHANAFHMAVASEPLEEAMARILAMGGGAPTSRRRLTV